jgi:acetyl esterase/lipase
MQLLYILAPAIFPGLALLIWSQAPIYGLWLLKIFVTEANIFFAFAAVLIATLYRAQGQGLVATVTAFGLFVSGLALLSPYMSALKVASDHGFPLTVVLPANITNSVAGEGGESARQASKPLETFIYKTTADQKSLAMDFYRSSSAELLAPTIILVHGGSWRSGDRQEMQWLPRTLAKRGYSVASIDYQMVPDATFPSPVQDVDAAIEYLKAHSKDFGIDVKRLVLMGRSAGAQIAAATAYQRNDIRGVIDLYGPMDMIWGYENSKPWHIVDGQAVIGAYLGGSPSDRRSVYDAASPVSHVSTSTPPTLILHGTKDELVSIEHSRMLVAKLSENKIAHELIEFPWATHGFDFVPFGPASKLMMAAIERFLSRHLAT